MMNVHVFVAIYVIYAVIALFWTSSRRAKFLLRHRRISPERLHCDSFPSAPIVIDLQIESSTGPRSSRIPGALAVSDAELRDLLRWAPPGTTFVFRDERANPQLDPAVEQTLLKAGIDSVYWLDARADLPR